MYDIGEHKDTLFCCQTTTTLMPSVLSTMSEICLWLNADACVLLASLHSLTPT